MPRLTRPTAPRPTAAQLSYGSCTVILSTLAMLLLSQTSSVPGVALISLVGLVLGLLVAMTVPRPKPSRAASQVVASSAAVAPRERVPVQASSVQASVQASVQVPAHQD